METSGGSADLILRLLKRALALGLACVTIGLTAGLSPQTMTRQGATAEAPPTPGPDEMAMREELSRIHSRGGPLGGLNGTEPPSGGLVHIVGPRETLLSIAYDFRIKPDELLDYNALRRPSQVRPGIPLRIPGDKPVTAMSVVGGGSITYRASSEDHFPWGWCTWYVAQRRDVPWSGDARTWYGSAKALGWATGQTPQPGAIMVTNESYWYGHVAYVEQVNLDGSWLVSEMNYAMWGGVDMRTIRPGQVPLIGFIY